MHEKYITLFKELLKNAEITAEKVAELNRKNNDEKRENVALTMRDDYVKLADKMKDENFSVKDLTKAEYAKLFVATFVFTENLKADIERLKKILQGYEIDVIPKLDRIVQECSTDEEAHKLAEKLFQIVEK